MNLPLRIFVLAACPALHLCRGRGVFFFVAVAVARTAANLDTRGAKATSEGDRQMIHAAWQR